MSEDQKLSELKLFTLDDLSDRWGCEEKDLISYSELGQLTIVVIPPHVEKVLEDLEGADDYEDFYLKVDRSIIQNTWLNRDKSDERLPRFKVAYSHYGDEVTFPKEVSITRDHFRVTQWEIERFEKEYGNPRNIVISKFLLSKDNSLYWKSFCQKVDQAIELFPDYQKEVREIRREIELEKINDWLQNAVEDVSSREAELIKKVLTDVFNLNK
jgi:hypothetical protein